MTAETQPREFPRGSEAMAPATVGLTDSAGPVPGSASVASAFVESASVALPPISWRDSLAGSALVIRDRPSLIAVGLLGFLARGGLIAFLLPIVALPTPTGISNFIGGTALTGAGASDHLVRLIAIGISLVVLALVAGTVLGAIADVLLAREAVAFRITRERGIVTEHGRSVVAAEARAALLVSGSAVGGVLVVRAIALIPVAVAVAWGTSRLVAAGYHQLILPDDLSLPLAVRILVEALPAAIAVVAVWLASEFVAGLAVRHLLLGGRSVPAALGLAVVGLARRPLTTLATFILGAVAVAAIALPTLVIAAMLWSRLQALLADDVPILLLLPATLVFVLAWGGGLLGVGAATAWRSIAGSIDVTRARPASAGGAIVNPRVAAAPAE